MTIIIAIDSLKGCLTSEEANGAAREALLRTGAGIVTLPVSDGGEGFLTAMHAARGGRMVECEVADPLMRPIRARYLISEERHAVIELAQASGLGLLSPGERNPLTTSSYGTGQLIADALRHGATNITIGLGGSATSDCGRGLLQALEGTDLTGVCLLLATDVRNPLLGPQGAARVFAPQKGADEAMVEELERRAHLFARESALRCGHDYSDAPGAGAAGGVGYALMQYFGARCMSGAELVLDATRFDAHLRDAALVITGEGHADRQTLMGKLPSVVLARARRYGIPVWLVAGQVSDAETLRDVGFSRVLRITPETMPTDEAVRPDVARRNLTDTLAACRADAVALLPARPDDHPQHS